MSFRNLDKVFEPGSIAIFDASEENPETKTVLENLSKNWEGEVYPISSEEAKVHGFETFSSLEELPESVDLGVMSSDEPVDLEKVERCGKRGIDSLIIISPSGYVETTPEKEELEDELKRISQKYEMRIMGPSCFGVIHPYENLNVSLSDQMPEPGEITFISQNGALSSSALDWAIDSKITFSSFVSIGDTVDIDFGDLIDYFGRDIETESILMYIEEIKDSKKFMSAARGVARTKPLMAVKSKKYKKDFREEIFSLLGDVVGADELYEGLFRRAGITRVETVEDLFSCSEILARQNLPEGPKLAIVSNVSEQASKAGNALMDMGGVKASFSDNVVEKLQDVSSFENDLDNPLVLEKDVSGGVLRETLEVCLDDGDIDGVLCIHSPSEKLSSLEAAEAISELKNVSDKPILACWVGDSSREGRDYLRDKGFSVQTKPEKSIEAYMYLYHHARNLERLLETPEEPPVDRAPPKYHLKVMLRRIAREDRTVLSEGESKKLLETYGFSTPEMFEAETSEEAAKCASRLDFPVVLKIDSPDILQKDEVGGIALNLSSEQEVEERFEKMMENVKDRKPSADIDGVTIHKTVQNPEFEFIMGSAKDPVFGSSIVFGEGGRELDRANNISVGFPPLNQTLANRLLEDAGVLEKIRNREDSSEIIGKLEKHLLRLSELIMDFPEIEEIKINPVAYTEDDLLALDARIIISKEETLEEKESKDHLIIEPYPRKYVEEWKLDDGREVTLRPIKPEDEPLEFDLFDTFSQETWRYRFFGPMKEVTHEDMVRFTNIDYRREMAIIGELEEDGERKMIGVGRLIIGPGGDSGEFAVVVGDPWHSLGLGKKLVDSIIGVAEDKGLNEIWGTMLKNNIKMIGLCEKLGFVKEEESEDTVKMTLKL